VETARPDFARDPSVVYKERKAISGSMVQEGHG